MKIKRIKAFSESLGSVFLLLALVIVAPPAIAAETIARTNEGRTVVLRDDGTWVFSNDIGAPADGAFGAIPWGSARKSVMKTTGVEPGYLGGQLTGRETGLLGLDFLTFYYFSDDKLVRGRYVLSGEHSNQNDFIQDYQEIKAALETKYGPPETDEIIWRNEGYRDDANQYGYAISLGQLTYKADWEGEDTDITLQLSGDNYKITVFLEYTSNALRHLEERDRRATIDEKL